MSDVGARAPSRSREAGARSAMATYLYCIRNDPGPVPPNLIGLDGLRVRSIYATGLTAWVSDMADVPVRSTLERVKSHDAVCTAAMAAGETPLPIRFVQTFADDGATASAIAARRPVLRERLSRVAGCIEPRVVVSHGRDADAPTGLFGRQPADDPFDQSVAGRGTAFLRRLAREGRADLAREVSCEDVRHVVRTAAKELIVDQQRREAARGVSLFPLLVRRSDLDACRSIIRASLPSQGIEATLLGPFPPYSFAGDA